MCHRSCFCRQGRGLQERD
uniref:Uncharacterized protein n=1 Tax=Anguilla anguilla TaxID=7936 RepID=A0A0E9P510_ANGAN